MLQSHWLRTPNCPPKPVELEAHGALGGLIKQNYGLGWWQTVDDYGPCSTRGGVILHLSGWLSGCNPCVSFFLSACLPGWLSTPGSGCLAVNPWTELPLCREHSSKPILHFRGKEPSVHSSADHSLSPDITSQASLMHAPC